MIAPFVFAIVFLCHAFYIRHVTITPPSGWAEVDVATAHFGFDPYLYGKDYFVGFSYALGASFSAWMVARLIASRRASTGLAAAMSDSIR